MIWPQQNRHQMSGQEERDEQSQGEKPGLGKLSTQPCSAPVEAGVVAPAEAGFLSSPPRQLLPVAVVVVLVVAAQGREAPLADGKGKEDLGARIHPHLHEAQESGRGN